MPIESPHADEVKKKSERPTERLIHSACALRAIESITHFLQFRKGGGGGGRRVTALMCVLAVVLCMYPNVIERERKGKLSHIQTA